MTVPGLTLTQDVTRVAGEMNLAPTREHRAEIDLIASALADWNEDAGALLIDGQEPGRWLRTQMAGMGIPTRPSQPSQPAPACPRISGDGQHILLEHPGGARWVQRGALADMILGFSQEDHAAQAREAAGWANPWAPEHFNRTRQVLLSKIDPARAAILKSQAGTKP